MENKKEYLERKALEFKEMDEMMGKVRNDNNHRMR